MNQVKNRLAALSLLDRAFRLLDDARIGSLYESLDEESRDAVQHVASVKGQELGTPALVEAIKATAAKGRMNGDLERLSVLLTDACLNDCIEALGDRADDPSEAELRVVLPTIIAAHTLSVTQVMLASVVTGEALASPIITRLLKSDEAWKLPPAETVTAAPAPVRSTVDDATRQALKDQRRARKQAEQDEARRRREQQAAARRK
ncbi:MAG: hypothetical protein ACKOA6_05650 [Actinomycetota bacterium]